MKYEEDKISERKKSRKGRGEERPESGEIGLGFSLTGMAERIRTYEVLCINLCITAFADTLFVLQKGKRLLLIGFFSMISVFSLLVCFCQPLQSLYAVGSSAFVL